MWRCGQPGLVRCGLRVPSPFLFFFFFFPAFIAIVFGVLAMQERSSSFQGARYGGTAQGKGPGNRGAVCA